MLRRVLLGEMNNLRDLGGYPLPGGRETVWERFFRSDLPVGLSEADCLWLLDRRITTVIDLRSAEEVERRPDQLRDCPGFRYIHRSLEGGEHLTASEAEMGSGYFRILEDLGCVGGILREIARAPEGVLFHCTAGKDRTGLIAALLLSLAGVSRADILADYQVSETYLAGLIRKLHVDFPDLPAFVGRSRAHYLSECLERLNQTYGSVPAYLSACGLSEAELGQLRKKLTDIE